MQNTNENLAFDDYCRIRHHDFSSRNGVDIIEYFLINNSITSVTNITKVIKMAGKIAKYTFANVASVT